LLLNITGKGVNASQHDDWSSLWNILAPPKTKHLLWRVSKGCLPTRKRLQEKHVLCPSVCPLCNIDDETDSHILFNCTASLEAWQSAGLNDVFARRIQHGVDARTIIHEICSCEDAEKARMFAMVAWVLWNNRNNKVWNEVAEPARNLGFKAKHMWEEWYTVFKQQQQGRISLAGHQHATTWEKPIQGWYKCNVDAGFHKELNKTSTGWCLRDHMGRFIRAETTWLEGNCSIMEGESIALLEALHAMEQQGLTHVIIESDSKSVVDAISHLRGGNSEFSIFISHINNVLSCNPNFVVKFIKRQANIVAHTLARATIYWSNRCTFETLSLCISTLLFNEMN
jgi:ribonuclease HI